MESKHLAGRTASSSGIVPPVQTVPPPVPALQRPQPRPSVQEAEHVVCSYPALQQVPVRVLLCGALRSPPPKRVLAPMGPQSLRGLLGSVFGVVCADAQPDALRALASAHAVRQRGRGADALMEPVVALSGCLSGLQLSAVVSGLLAPLDAGERAQCRDGLLAGLLDRQAGFQVQGLSRLVLAAAHAWGGDAMPHHDLDAFMRLLAQAPAAHDRDLTGAILDGLCRGLALDEASEPPLVEALAQALCQGAGLLENPMDAELMMRRLALAAGGPQMGPWMRARLVDALLDAPDLATEQLGFMLLGLAVALEAPQPRGFRAPGVASPDLDQKGAKEGAKEGAKDRKAATAGELASMQPTLPSLSALLAASLELSQPQFARWGQAVGVALRTEGEEGLAEIEQALRESARLLDTGRLTALACGLGSGLCDGCPPGGTVLDPNGLRAMVIGLPEARQRAAVRFGFHLSTDPVRACAGRQDRSAWLQVAWQLPGVVNARTAPLWFGQALEADGPPAGRAGVLATLVVHGALHLGDDAIRQVRDLALASDADLVPAIYGGWIESGLPQALFDASAPATDDLRAERHLVARRLALVDEELQALPGLACGEHQRLRLRSLLTGWRKDLRRGLATTAAETKSGLSASPASR